MSCDESPYVIYTRCADQGESHCVFWIVLRCLSKSDIVFNGNPSRSPSFSVSCFLFPVWRWNVSHSSVRGQRPRDHNGAQTMLGDEHVWAVRRIEPVWAGYGVRVLLAEHAAPAARAILGAHSVLQVSQVRILCIALKLTCHWWRRKPLLIERFTC